MSLDGQPLRIPSIGLVGHGSFLVCRAVSHFGAMVDAIGTHSFGCLLVWRLKWGEF